MQAISGDFISTITVVVRRLGRPGSLIRLKSTNWMSRGLLHHKYLALTLQVNHSVPYAKY